MNVAVRTLNTKIFRFPMMDLTIPSRLRILIIGLLIAILMSSFGLIYIKDMNRRLTGQLQYMQNDYESARAQYSQLLLEKSTWASSVHVEQVASQQLRMITPPPKSVVII